MLTAQVAVYSIIPIHCLALDTVFVSTNACKLLSCASFSVRVKCKTLDQNGRVTACMEIGTDLEGSSCPPTLGSYSRNKCTKSPAPGAGEVSEPGLMSQVGTVREVVCA
jgi:hypothetical protein